MFQELPSGVIHMLQKRLPRVEPDIKRLNRGAFTCHDDLLWKFKSIIAARPVVLHLDKRKLEVVTDNASASNTCAISIPYSGEKSLLDYGLADEELCLSIGSESIGWSITVMPSESSEELAERVNLEIAKIVGFVEVVNCDILAYNAWAEERISELLAARKEQLDAAHEIAIVHRETLSRSESRPVIVKVSDLDIIPVTPTQAVADELTTLGFRVAAVMKSGVISGLYDGDLDDLYAVAGVSSVRYATDAIEIVMG